MPDQEHRALHAYLTPEAHNGWQNFADNEGCSVTALVEVIGRRFAVAAATEEAPFFLSPTDTDVLVKDARRIDAGRRRRGPAPVGDRL